MCKHGSETPVEITIPADLSHSGEARAKVVGIDACIAPLVAALETAGITMRGSCCGHGQRDGEILLADGRVLVIRPSSIAEDTGTRDVGLEILSLEVAMTHPDLTEDGRAHLVRLRDRLRASTRRTNRCECGGERWEEPTITGALALVCSSCPRIEPVAAPESSPAVDAIDWEVEYTALRDKILSEFGDFVDDGEEAEGYLLERGLEKVAAKLMALESPAVDAGTTEADALPRSGSVRVFHDAAMRAADEMLAARASGDAVMVKVYAEQAFDYEVSAVRQAVRADASPATLSILLSSLDALGREMCGLPAATPRPRSPAVDDETVKLLPRLAKAASAFCAELQEDAEGVPQAELRELHAALDAVDLAKLEADWLTHLAVCYRCNEDPRDPCGIGERIRGEMDALDERIDSAATRRSPESVPEANNA